MFQDVLVKKIGKLYAYDFLTSLLEFYWLAIQKDFIALATFPYM